jgi:hypothetical protein
VTAANQPDPISFEQSVRTALKPFIDEMGDTRINNLWYLSGGNPIDQILAAYRAELLRELKALGQVYMTSSPDQHKARENLSLALWKRINELSQQPASQSEIQRLKEDTHGA